MIRPVTGAADTPSALRESRRSTGHPRLLLQWPASLRPLTFDLVVNRAFGHICTAPRTWLYCVAS